MRARPQVAIAHDYLTQRGGAERVVLAMARAFPEAQIHTTLYNPETTFPEFADLDIVTSPLNRLSMIRRHHRLALPVLAPVASRMNVDADVVLTSTSGWAHGFNTTGRTVVYCHAPARWLYKPREYLGGHHLQSFAGMALGILTPPLRAWDKRVALRATTYLANSRVVSDRIQEAYGITAEVLAPPHGVAADGDVDPVPELEGWGDYHLVVSRLLPYKNVGAAIDAFRGLPDERIVVVGHGPLRHGLVSHLPSNGRLVSHLSDAQMRWVYSHAHALIAPSIEDFGLTPIEAAAFGKPTIALRGGGYLDTVIEGVTGLFVDLATPDAIAEAVKLSRAQSWDSAYLMEHGASFGDDRFADALRQRVRAQLAIS